MLKYEILKCCRKVLNVIEKVHLIGNTKRKIKIKFMVF